MSESSKSGMTKAAMEERRRLGVRNVLAGRSHADVADFLGVHPVTVGKWMTAHRAGGDAALAAKPAPGRPRLLTDEQEAEVLSWLLRKPSEFGFHTELWTSDRIAKVIHERFKVRFHPGYLRTWLARRGCAPLKPARPAKQRDAEVVAGWVRRDFPTLKKESPRTAATSF